VLYAQRLQTFQKCAVFICFLLCWQLQHADC
jgi:hypothetical protein